MVKELVVRVSIIYAQDDVSKSDLKWLIELDQDGEFAASSTGDSLGSAFEQAYLIVAHEAVVP